MPQQRAADDYPTIRARMEELRRERQPAPAAASHPGGGAGGPGAPGHRGPCACGMSLFPDECDGSCKALDMVTPRS
jgi:hypothetical protein